MARLPRFVLPGQPQHVIQRGNNRQAIFITLMDYEYYLEKLFYASKQQECQIHAYVLMTNHVHLLVTPLKADGISKMMQIVGRYYVQYFNSCYQRTGTLWEGRYKATLINSEQYLFTCMRYIELNPVRAGMVADPSEYQWSSYRHNAFGEDDAIIQSHLEYEHLGKTLEERQKQYQGLFNIPIGKETLNEVREATNKCWALGDSEFKKNLVQKLARRMSPSPKGGDRRSRKYQNGGSINRV